MSRANIYDRSTIERLYPQAAFDRDARLNDDAKTQILHGLRIVSPPDVKGDFDLVHASHQVGELNPEGDAVFVYPHLRHGYDALMQDPDYGGPREKCDALAQAQIQVADYEAFIGRVIETAKSVDFKPAIGRHEDRLRGFHGG